MRQVTVTADIAGDGGKYNTVPVIIDQYIAPNAVTYVKSNDGTVEVSTTDPYPKVNGDFVEANFTWVTAGTDYPNATGFLGQPYRAIRLKNATQGATLTVIQAGVK